METLKFIGLILLATALFFIPGIGWALGAAVALYAVWLAIRDFDSALAERDRSRGPSDRR